MTWDGQDLTKGFRFESPDDGNPDDRTVLSVALPRPVAPGETVALKISWKAKAPRVFARAGYVRDFYLRRAVVPEDRRSRAGGEPAPRRAGVELPPVPRELRVLRRLGRLPRRHDGPGELRRRLGRDEGRRDAGRRQEDARLRAEGRPRLRLVGRPPLRPEGVALRPGEGHPEGGARAGVEDPRPDAGGASQGLPSREALLLHAARARVARGRKHEDAQKWALAWFGLWAFPYPYPQVSMVDPPEDGWGAGGMEYQTLYTTSGLEVARLLAGKRPPRSRDGDDPRVRPRLLVRDARLERIRGELDGRGDRLVHRGRHRRPALPLVLRVPVGRRRPRRGAAAA